MSEKKHNPRALAMEVLCAAENSRDRSVTEVLSEALNTSALSRLDEALATELVYSTLRRRLTLDWVIEKFSGVKVRRIEQPLLDILRLGILQLLYMETVPDYAAVDESVELAGRMLGPKAAGFANSVLRKVAASASSIPFPGREKDAVGYISIVHSHPEWMVRRWVERFGEEAAESVCVVNNTPPPITARANVLKVSRENLIGKLAEEGVEAVAREEAAVEIVKCPKAISGLLSFREGLFYLQDVSAMIPTRMLAPAEGEKVLDLCSAPGGKATHLAELMGNQGLVVACDVDERKMAPLRENIERLGTTIVRPLVADGTRIDAVLRTDFDRVLVDAPCSNTGVLRRRVEARWRLRQSDLNQLHKTQVNLLRSACGVLKRGGTLIYITCSIEAEENQGVVKQVLSERADLKVAEERAFLPRPGRGDGGYAAKMVKR
jgi:16S rRNA (cytosine967-C5)-methyltransferase